MVTIPTTEEELRQALVHLDTPVGEALSHMDNEVAIIIDDESKLCGIATDGDVRRAFLEGADMSTPVSKIMSSKPMTIFPGMKREDILSLMLLNKIRHLPVVNSQGIPVGLELLRNQYDDENIAQAVLMAGGKGTRLRPLTYDTPKPLLKVGNETILDNVLHGLKSSGVNDVIISVNYLGKQIRDHVNDGNGHELNVDFVEEKEALGTAGALSLLSPRPEKSFFVMNADLMTEMDYRAFSRFHKDQGNDFSVCVRKIKNSIPFGVVELADDKRTVSSIEEKPEYSFLVNAGIYMLEPEIIDLIPENTFFDMVSLIRKAMSEGYKVGAFPIVEYWRDIGQHQEMQTAVREWHSKHTREAAASVPGFKELHLKEV